MSASLRTSRPTWDETWMGVARTIAQRSPCSRDKVGAVIVDTFNRIVDTGYNGPPAGWRPIHTDDCSVWCERAKTQEPLCGSREIHPPHVNPLLYGECHGYPGLIYAKRLMLDYSDCPSLHAEANALMFSDRRLRVGGTIYVTSGTCSGCAKLVANSGLTRAVYGGNLRPHRESERWYDFLRDCGLEVVTYA